MHSKPINLSFISLRQINHLQINAQLGMFKDLMLVFEHEFIPDQNKYLLEAVQQNTERLNTGIDGIISKYAKNFPELHKVKSFLSLLPNGHFFVIMNGRLEDTNACLQYFSYLEKHHEEHGIRIERSIDTLDWGALPQMYNIAMYGHQRERIGTWRKDQRVCRFCSGKIGETNRFNKEVTFNNNAHAFSEALGNKNVILYEECDACNERFGSDTGIEFSLIALLKMFRAVYSLRGKNGMKAVDGENFTLWADGESIDIKYDGNILEELELEKLNLELVLKDKFIPQNIYRCLCKFVLSVVDSDDIEFFSKLLNGSTTTLMQLNYLK